MDAVGTGPSAQNYFPRITTDTNFLVSCWTFVDSVDFIIERTERYFEFRPLVVEVSCSFTNGSFRVFVVTINCRKRRFDLGFVTSFRCFDTMEFAFLTSTFSAHWQSSVPSCAHCTHRVCTSAWTALFQRFLGPFRPRLSYLWARFACLAWKTLCD